MTKTKLNPGHGYSMGATHWITIPPEVLELWAVSKEKPKMNTRNIEIVPVLNGWICFIGCQRVVFTDKQTMLRELGKYYADPAKVEREYIAKRVNRTEGAPVPEGNMLVPPSVAAQLRGSTTERR